ncbi:lopap-like [Anticarsia gemmatalis]|uniref:lopap-like n=1 Tax=Anticarsia gemmatalis TaxID=129554 RepID=UPI003F76ACE2
MFVRLFLVFLLVVYYGELCEGQVLQFGTCVEVESMQYFDIERFLGEWYEIERFPVWYEQYGNCAYKRLQYCGRRVEIDHVYVKEGIQFSLRVNSSYAPGDEAVFVIPETNIDPIGIPLQVISSDYTNYAVLYGCKSNEELGIKYLVAWILSRTSSLLEDILQKARRELDSIPFANVIYLEKVDHTDRQCAHHWTAHVQAENITEAVRNQMIMDYGIYAMKLV